MNSKIAYKVLCCLCQHHQMRDVRTMHDRCWISTQQHSGQFTSTASIPPWTHYATPLQCITPYPGTPHTSNLVECCIPSMTDSRALAEHF